MTYFGFLLIFLIIPIILLAIVAYVDQRQGRHRPAALQAWPIWKAILLHVFIAVLYTTIWDNYLVATRVWWYDPELVTGLTLGWVPIEEYTFFLLQPILAGLWLLLLARRLQIVISSESLISRLRVILPVLLGLFWLASLMILIAGKGPGTYLALELAWALPPIGLQLAFGADILWRYRRLVLITIVTLTAYLSAADAIAINLGTWTINPEQSLNILVGGILPVEEALFFLLTNTLITFGIVLVIAEESQARFVGIRLRLSKASSVS